MQSKKIPMTFLKYFGFWKKNCHRHPYAFIIYLDILQCLRLSQPHVLGRANDQVCQCSLNSYFNIMYTHKIHTMTSKGDSYSISTGVFQGDPLSTFFLPLSLQPSLDHTGMLSDPFKLNLKVFAYVDDIYSFREYDHFLHAISSLTALLSEGPSVSINDLKCSFYPIPDSPPVNPPFIFVDYFVILGTPFGCEEFVNNFVSKAIEKSRIKLDAFTKLEGLQLLLLLRLISIMFLLLLDFLIYHLNRTCTVTLEVLLGHRTQNLPYPPLQTYRHVLV